MLGTVPDPWDIYMKKTNKKACPYAVYIIEKLMGGECNRTKNTINI